MKYGKHTDLVALATEIQRRAAAKVDLIADTKNISMDIVSDNRLRVGPEFRQIPILRIGADRQFAINDIAHDQIGQHLEIPAKYYDKMLADAPELLATNVNAWFLKYPAQRMVRTLDGTTRAFLSNSYRPLENEDLAEAVLEPVMDMGLNVMSAEITDRRLYIKAVDPRVSRELEAKGGRFGDGKHNIVRCLAPAITISNSEVGMGALSILGGVYDGFCSNLATFGERSMRKYHVGSKHDLAGEETYALLSDETRRKTDAALWAQVRDIVRAAFEKAKFDALCDKIAETTTQEITGDVVKVVELSARRFGFNETENKSILDRLIKGADLTRFGLFNAITAAAEDVDDYDRATEFEKIGGQIIELPRQEWKVLAEAA